MKRGTIDCLPPNKDALLLHIRRANYVSYICRRCTYPSINVPDFRNHSWQVDDGKVKVHWLSCLSAMDHILECASCNCKTGCKVYMQRKEDLVCTEICGCTECENQQTTDVPDGDDVYNDVEADDSDVE